MSYTTIQTTPKTSYIRRPVRFGLAGKPDQGNLQHSAQNGVWITTERLPAKVGGLGEVSKTIPEAFAQFMPKKDLRIIVPYLGKHRDEDQKKKAALEKGDTKVSQGDVFQPTGARLSFKMEDGRKAQLDVLQKFEDATGFEAYNKSREAGEKVGNWVYALRNDDYFMGKTENGVEAEKGLSDYTYTPEAGEFDKVMLFNRGASELVPLLDGNSTDPRAARLSRFNNRHKSESFPKKNGVQAPAGKDFRKNIDFVIAHDWLTGSVNNELPDYPYTRKHFVVHNMFDKEQAPNVAYKTNLLSPSRLFNQERTFSALNAGIEPSDSIWVNNNFKKTILESTLPNGAPFIKTLRDKSEAGRTFNLHHGLSADYTASGPLAPKCLEEKYGDWLKAAQSSRTRLENSLTGLREKEQALQSQNDEQKLKLLKKAITKAETDLKKVNIQIEAAQAGDKASKDGKPYQFQKLQIDAGQAIPTVEQMKQFKAANKAALQKKLGLEQDKDAVIISWAARLDPRQKNVYLFMKSVEDTLKNNDNKTQFVVVGDTTDPEIMAWIERINKEYNTTPGKNRVYMPNVFANQDEVKQINAGADFTALPSLYEPYGLTQLEAMKMGSLPIVHGVDGLRTTVSDPEINEKLKKITPEDEWEAVWGMPQNGILMEPVDIDEYKEYIDNRQDFESLKALKSLYEKHIRLAQEKPESKTEKERQKEQENIAEAFKALSGKMEGLANTFEYKLESFQLQSKALKEALEKLERKGALSLKRKNELDAKIKWLNDTKNVDTLDDKARQAREAYNIVKNNPADLEAQYARVLELVRPDEAINENAAKKLTSAIDRGIALIRDKDPKKNAQTRINAIKYVNTEHNWEKILERFYKPALESDEIDAAIRDSHTEELNAFQALGQPKSTPEKEYAQTRPGTPSKPSGFGGTIQYYWNTFWNLNQRFWAAIGRLFSLRKD